VGSNPTSSARRLSPKRCLNAVGFAADDSNVDPISGSIVPSTLIALMALAAVASTYRLGHHLRPALVRSGEPTSSAAAVTALARANAAHMAGVSHIRIIESGGRLEARVLPGQGTSCGHSAS
jgi:hypothetical protein